MKIYNKKKEKLMLNLTINLTILFLEKFSPESEENNKEFQIYT